MPNKHQQFSSRASESEVAPTRTSARSRNQLEGIVPELTQQRSSPQASKPKTIPKGPRRTSTSTGQHTDVSLPSFSRPLSAGTPPSNIITLRFKKTRISTTAEGLLHFEGVTDLPQRPVTEYPQSSASPMVEEVLPLETVPEQLQSAVSPTTEGILHFEGVLAQVKRRTPPMQDDVTVIESGEAGWNNAAKRRRQSEVLESRKRTRPSLG